ncbi:MAG: hypothetical protein NTW87_31275 [Planctomycetota bacterium]|nr:hypothetical protein [Planctomycetota bacterium]
MPRILLPLALLVFGLSAYAGEEPRPPSTRIIFEHKGALGDNEAPGVAVDGAKAAFGFGADLMIADLLSGEVKVLKGIIPAKANQTFEFQVVGMRGGVVYGYKCDRIYLPGPPDKPKPFNPDGENKELLAVTLQDSSVRSLARLPRWALVADAMLGENLVYVADKDLHLLPVDGPAKPQKLPLSDTATRRRPQLTNGEIFGSCARSFYYCKPGAAGVTRCPLETPALAPFLNGYAVAYKSGDLLLVSDAPGRPDGLFKGVQATDLSGQPRWKSPLAGHLAVGADGLIAALDYDIAFGLARDDGRVLWHAYISPLALYSGSNSVRGQAAGADPADARASVGELFRGSKQPWQRTPLATDLADTPDALTAALPDLKAQLANAPTPDLVLAFYWVNIPEVAQTIARLIADRKLDHYKRRALVRTLACHPDEKLLLSLLQAISRDASIEPVKIREEAALLLRLLQPPGTQATNDVRPAYSTDRAALTADLKKGLASSDAAVRTRALETLSRAPDSVIIGLAAELKALPADQERAAGAKLVEEARKRLELIKQTQER